MPLNALESLNELVASGDLSALRGLAVPAHRELNRSLSFRSAMMVSAHNLKHLSKIPSLDAECIMLNLEDGVSIEQKPLALILCALALSTFAQSKQKMVVRVNALEEGGAEEIGYLNPFKPDAIRVPKIRNVREVERIVELVDEEIEIHLSIETKEAWLSLKELAIHPRITVFYLGFLDLFADLGLSQTLLIPDNPLVQTMLSQFLIMCRACGVKPVSFVYQDYKNSDGLRDWLELEKLMGFDAKGCIAPVQVELIHEYFGHAAREIEKCKEIIKLFEEHRSRGISGFVDERFGFIDEPIYKGALVIIEACTKHGNG